MSCKPEVACSIPGFSIKPLSMSLLVLLSYNKHTNHKPSWPSTGYYYPWKSHKKFFQAKLLDSYLPSGSRRPVCCRRLHLLQYFVNKIIEGSVETVQMHRPT